MDTYLVVLRIVHILAGVFWVGAALTAFLFLQPAAREVGPAAGPFMAHLAGKKKLVDWVLRSGGARDPGGAPHVLACHGRTLGGIHHDRVRHLPHDRGALRDDRVLARSDDREADAHGDPRARARGRRERRHPHAERRRSSKRSASEAKTWGRSSCRC